MNGTRAVVEALCDHSGVAAVTFVGSSPVARAVNHRCRATHKKVHVPFSRATHKKVFALATNRAPVATVAAVCGALVLWWVRETKTSK